jgi:hypothetical protein
MEISVTLDDLAIGLERGLYGMAHLVQVAAQVPFALVGRVIAELRHAMADGLHVRRHVRLPQRGGIIEHGGMLDVLPGIDGGARRRTDAGRRLMVGEGDGVGLDPFAGQHRERPFVEEVFLVDQDEEDVVAAGRRVGRHHRAGRRRQDPGRHGLGTRPLGQTVRAQQGGATGEHGAAERSGFDHASSPSRPRDCLAPGDAELRNAPDRVIGPVAAQYSGMLRKHRITVPPPYRHRHDYHSFRAVFPALFSLPWPPSSVARLPGRTYF